MSELAVTVNYALDDTERLVRAALKDQGFGVLTEIDVAQTFREKLNVTRRPLKILGACNPVMAHEAITRSIDVTLALPCNVVLDEVSPTQTKVSIADPTTMMPGATFSDLVDDAKSRLTKVLQSLSDQ